MPPAVLAGLNKSAPDSPPLWRGWRARAAQWSGCAILLIAGGCGGNSLAGHEFCLIARPILTSPADSEETLRQIDRHNAAGEELCNW